MGHLERGILNVAPTFQSFIVKLFPPIYSSLRLPALLSASPERLSLLLILSLAFSVPSVFSTPSFPVYSARPFYIYRFLSPAGSLTASSRVQISLTKSFKLSWVSGNLFSSCILSCYSFLPLIPEFHQPFPLICSSLTILNRRFKLLLISP
jgi:hypothetical protein